VREGEHWAAWERGEIRCPYCVGLDDQDFEATCDCSRWSWEKNGHGISIQVVGSDNPPVPVKPHTYVPPTD
jgi:hypothetical protein